MRKLVLSAFLAFALLGASTPAAAGPRLEQVQVNLPQVQAYFYTESPVTEISATLDGQDLVLDEIRALDASKDSTEYIFMIDCSTSMNTAQLDAIKSAITGFAGTIGSKDTFTLITFGVAIDVPITRGTDVAALGEALRPLAPNQPGTVLFNALEKMLELNAQPEAAMTRKLCIAFTDSVNYADGGYTKDDVEALDNQVGIPIYVMGFDTGDKASLDTMAEVATLSGGALYVVNPQTLAAKFDEAIVFTQSAYVALFHAQSNVITKPVQPFVMTPAGGAQLTDQVPVQHSIPDTEAPTVTEISLAGDNAIRILYSEPVQGADIAANYRVTDSAGQDLAVSAAAYDAKTKTADLSLTGIPADGILTVFFSNITDMSQERNLITSEATLILGAAGSIVDSAVAPVVSEAPVVSVPVLVGGANLSFLWWLIPLILLALLAAWLLLRKKPEPIDEVRPPVYQKPVQPVAPCKINMHVTDHSIGKTWVVAKPIERALIFGRGPSSDVVLNDPAMDEQVFVIEQKNRNYSISSLSNNCSTYVNDKMIGASHPLRKGDVITAGNHKMVFEAD